MKNTSFGAIKSPPDYRDIYVGQLGLPIETPATYFVDVVNLPIWYQRAIGACVGHAAAKYKQKLDEIDTGIIVPLSARFLYALAKCRDGIAGEGTYPRLVAKILYDEGCATEATCPNDTLLIHEEYVYRRNENNIPKSAKDEAYKAKISGYAFVNNDLQSIKQAIVNSNGFVSLVQVSARWYTDALGNITWDKDKILPNFPSPDTISGHEIYIYGYRTTASDVEIHYINSWSDKWADCGKGYFLYSEYKKYILEMITFVDIPNTILEDAHNQPVTYSHYFQTSLQLGDTNEEVSNLQKALKMSGTFDYEITGYFGSITRKAVYDFQIKENVNLSWYEKYILRGSKVGPKTLLKLNSIYNK